MRAAREFVADDIPTVAAGATFYVLLAFFPAVAAFVSLYGLFADIPTAREHLSYLRGFLPGDVLRFVGDEMIRVTTTQASKLSWAFVLSLVISIWSANAGVSSLITGLNVAYEQKVLLDLVRLQVPATQLISLVPSRPAPWIAAIWRLSSWWWRYRLPNGRWALPISICSSSRVGPCWLGQLPAGDDRLWSCLAMDPIASRAESGVCGGPWCRFRQRRVA